MSSNEHERHISEIGVTSFDGGLQEAVVADEELRVFIEGVKEQFGAQSLEWPLSSAEAIKAISAGGLPQSVLFPVYQFLVHRGSGGALLDVESDPNRRNRKVLTEDQALALAAAAHTARENMDRYVGHKGFQSLADDTKERLGEHMLSGLLMNPAERAKRKKHEDEMSAGIEIVIALSEEPGSGQIVEPAVGEEESTEDEEEMIIGREEIGIYRKKLTETGEADVPDEVKIVLRRIFRYRNLLKGEDATYSLSEALRICDELLKKNPEVSDTSDLERRLLEDLDEESEEENTEHELS